MFFVLPAYENVIFEFYLVQNEVVEIRKRGNVKAEVDVFLFWSEVDFIGNLIFNLCLMH